MTPREVSRRTVLRGVVSAGLLHGAKVWSQRESPAVSWVLLGTGSGQGIYRARWNGATGEIGEAELAVATPKPTFLTRHPVLPVVYACNENSGQDATVTAFRVEGGGEAPKLTAIGSRPSHGDSPCHAGVNRQGSALFVANYGGGSFAAYALPLQDGSLGSPQSFSCAESKLCGSLGPQRDRQDAPHLHCATVSPDQRHVLACDLGDDAILVFPLAPGSAKLFGTPSRVAARPGSGPRHLAFHPNGRWLYCIHELDCTVDRYAWSAGRDGANLRLVPDSVVSVRAPHAPATPPSTAAEIVIPRDGRFLYTSTRFADVLNVFAIDAGTGHLTPVQQLPCGGKTPRHFALDPTEQWLVCTHQDSDSLAVFARDGASGRLSPKGTHKAQNPMCVVWL